MSKLRVDSEPGKKLAVTAELAHAKSLNEQSGRSSGPEPDAQRSLDRDVRVSRCLVVRGIDTTQLSRNIQTPTKIRI